MLCRIMFTFVALLFDALTAGAVLALVLIAWGVQ